MRNITTLDNSLWLADGERFQRAVHAALVRPCPTSAQIRERHRELMQLAKDMPTVQGSGLDDRNELFVATMDDVTGKARAEGTKAIRAVKGKVSVIPVYGPVDQRMTPEMDKAGGTPLDFVSYALENLLAKPDVGAIVLRFDSPGGSISGVQELADRIYEARSIKPIFAHADSMAASAALWLASACSMFISTPGGGAATVGSHGVYVMHVDETEAMAAEGVRITTVHAGKNKVEFSPYSELTADARAEMQARVDGIYDQFTLALKRNRNTTVDNVRANYGQGRMLTAQQALSVGMIDRILTFSELMSKLTGGDPQPASRGPSAEKMLRLFSFKEKESACA